MIEVPVIAAPKVVAAPVQAVPLKTKAFKILCLDNDETILEGMATLLSKWGYQVFKATEPEQALRLIQQENIQVWLVDQHLNQNKRSEERRVGKECRYLNLWSIYRIT